MLKTQFSSAVFNLADSKILKGFCALQTRKKALYEHLSFFLGGGCGTAPYKIQKIQSQIKNNVKLR